MKLLTCAGGTGGGVYPALAVIQALKTISEAFDPPLEVDLLWVGQVEGMEMEIVKRSDIRFEGIPSAGVHGVGLRALPGNVLRLSQGYLESRRILFHFEPDVLFFTGGYVAAPMAFAGRRVPSVVFVPDIEPGLALKTIARSVDRIAVTTEESGSYYSDPSKIKVTGYPTRQDLISWNQESAVRFFGLSANDSVLLVFGGSKGAQSINRAVINVLAELLQETQVIHISGKLGWEEVRSAQESLPQDLAGRYRAYPYLHEEMGAAFKIADLVLSRAGASVLGEFPAFGLPAILVPYPHAWRYQHTNAEYLAARGAAEVIEDGDLPQELLPKLRSILQDQAKLEAMSRSMASLARPEAARQIAALLLELGHPQSRKGLIQ